MLGKTNAAQGERLPKGSIVCWYHGRKNTTGSDHPTNNITSGYNKDFFTYESGVFTVLKDFDARVNIVCTGTRSASASITLTYSFRVNSQAVDGASGVTYTGNGTPAEFSHSFKAGDKVEIRGSQGTNSYFTDFGFFIETA